MRRIVTLKERRQLYHLYEQELPLREIADHMGFSERQIRYELGRGFTGQRNEYGRPAYDPVLAHRDYHAKSFHKG